MKATVDPILIIERRIVMTSDTITALRGMFHPGLTCEKEVLVVYLSKAAVTAAKEKNLPVQGKEKMVILRLEQKQRVVEMLWLRY